jgi:hypothetical protein
MKKVKLFEEFLVESVSLIYESSIGDIHIMAQEADSFTGFRKAFMDEYGKPKSVKELKQLEAWLQTIWNENQTNEGFVKEAKNNVYPEEVQKILDGLVDIGLMKKYQAGAFTNYGVWFIELPASAISITNIKRIEKVVPEFSIGTYVGYSGLSLRTNISVS